MAAGGVLVGRGYVQIRPEFTGDWSRRVTSRASSAGGRGGSSFTRAFGSAVSKGLGTALKGVGALAGVAVASSMSGAAAAAAALAPALATVGTAAGGLALGLGGLGEAFKAAAAGGEELDEALAKLAPNARSFVRAVQGVAPAWDAMRRSVQDALFAGIDTEITSLARATIPILHRQLTDTASIWNEIAKSASGAVREMAASGALEEFLAGANRSFAQLVDVPGQLLTSWVNLSIAAQPAFERMMAGFAGAVESVNARIAQGLASGGLREGIETAFGILAQLGDVLGAVLGAVSQLFKAASDAGGQLLGVLAAVFTEIGRVLALPQVQAQLRTLFGAVADIVGALLPVLGALIEAVVPLLAAIAPAFAAIAQALGPVLVQLAQVLGAALGPVIDALLPVVELVASALIGIVQAVMPLLEPIAQLIASLVSALTPALTPIIAIVTAIVEQLAGPLTAVIEALTPAFELVGQMIAEVFTQLEPLFPPLAAAMADFAGLLVGVVGEALTQVLRAIQPLIPIGVQLVETVFEAMRPVLPVLSAALAAIADAIGMILPPLAALVLEIYTQLMPVVEQLLPVIAQLAAQLGEALMEALPPLAEALVVLVEALMPLVPVVAELMTMLLELGTDILMQMITAVIDLTLAVVPLLPPLAELIGLVVRLATGVLSWLLPPLVELVRVLVGPFVSATSTAIGWIASIVGAISTLVTWIRDELGPKFRWLLDKVVRPVWNAIRDKIVNIWKDKIKPAFDALKRGVDAVRRGFETAKDGIKKAWDKVSGIAKKPVKFVIETVYNRGIRKVWNKVADLVDLKPLNKVYLPRGFKEGGRTRGGVPGKDSIPILAMADEYIVKRDSARKLGFGTLDYINRTGELPGFAAGGRVWESPVQRFADGGLIDKIKGAVKTVGGVVMDGVDFLSNPGKLWDKAVGFVKDLIGDIGRSRYAKMLAKIPVKMLSGLKDRIVNAAKSLFGLEGGKGVYPVNAKPGTPFGARGSMWSSGYHTGLDFPAPTGAAVRSIAGGSVAFTRYGGPYGKHIMLDHGKGMRSLYAHLSQIGATSGAVGKGKRIGAVGSTGNSSGPHLHLEVRKNGRAVDPMPYLYDRGGYLQPGLNLAYNGTGQPEPVFTSRQANALMGVAAGGGGLGDLSVSVYVGDREITDIARAEVRRSNGELVRTLRAGRG
ncbi:peptidoglycan DD-metalloendopeptidase family protein [Streptomyces sp. JJ66]|uniref:peptidoglycan DD-metalloendopeptidase family protein n=1 Tax=Streptomyces sp. JJ66 TaxID=2803843 RepID=UPI001C55F609|nr:peptidoglycan DD-metalloendopeptidase family protein [Streptomyces sp. JJ66]MBW1600901.1 peptidoglycan DD-metalloendopeptidase family protein [Streptomyces sp. JJ66]